MNKDKFNSQDIVDALSLKTGCSKQLGDAFLKALVASIEEALLQKDTVKVKNFGVFKLSWVAARKSVNVHNGKPIVLEGYYKLSFTPENELKKLVNRPYAHLETVVLGDDREKKVDPLFSLSEQANEIKGLLSEIETMQTADNSSSSSSSSSLHEEVESVPEMPEEDSKPEEKPVDSPEEPVVLAGASKESKVFEKTQNRRLVAALVLLFAFILLAFFFFSREDEAVLEKVATSKSVISDSKSVATLDMSVAASDELLPELSSDSDSDSDSDSLAAANLPKSAVPQVATDNFQEVFDNRMKDRELIATVSLKSGQYLASLAKEYYGSAHFWVYIYEFNREQIKNKNSLHEGMSIMIPKLDAQLIDLKDSRSVENAKALEEIYK